MVHRAVDGRMVLIGGLAAAALVIFGVGVARAVNLTPIQLFEINDANITDQAANPAPDWASLFDGSAQTPGPPPGPVATVSPMPGTGAVTSTFTVDPLAFDPLAGQEAIAGAGACVSGNGDPTVYTGAGGEKNGDVLTTDTWGSGSIPNNKDDLANVYAAAYDRGDGKIVIFFGLERVATSGSAHVDFEFYHSQVGLVADTPDQSNGCPTGHFTGTRSVGDIIITMDFDNGGRVGTPEIRRWSGSSYVVVTPNASAYGIAQNTATIDCGSWICRDTTGAASSTLAANLFVEGYLDTGDPNVNFTGCLSSFNVHTRSSPSFTATLKDFALGSFNTCATKSGSKFVDSNGDGSLTGDSKYTATGGWNIRLYKDGTAAGGTVGTLDATDTLVSTQATNNGDYSFGNLSPGTYFVCEETKTGWVQTYPNAGTANPTGETIYSACNVGVTGTAKYGYKFTTSSSGGSLSNNNFGNFQLITKSGSKFVDSNGDGSLTGDSKYTAAGGWNIRLYKDDGTTAGALDATDTLVSTQATVSGDYSFTGIGPGTYFVCEETKASWNQTYPNASTANPTGETIYNACNNLTGLAQYGYKFTASSGSNLTADNFGNAQLFRQIILTCLEATQTLVVSTVDSDGTFGNADDKDTIATAPTLNNFSGTQTDLQNYLCNLGGAQYNNLAAGDYPKTTRIPKP